MAVALSFCVRIDYQEPTYAARFDRPLRTYHSAFHVSAASADEAASLALREFRHIERISSVGWTRDVIRVVTTEDARDRSLER